MKKIIIASSLLLLCLLLTSCTSIDYKKAVTLQEESSYAESLEIFKNIEDYKDSAERISECEKMIDAIENFQTEKAIATQKNTELNTAISNAESLLLKKETALDETLIPAVETAVSEAKAAKKSIAEMPKTESEIVAAAEQLKAIDYTEVLTNLTEKKDALEKSIKQYKLVDAPSEAYIIECLKNVSNVVNISAVTEDNDPNGNLNKAGGYTAQVYFSCDLINQSSVYGTSVIEKGTDCGGSIEVYANSEDANKRNVYLSSFDGTMFASGSHTVIGTVLVRTSNKLTASQQKQLEADIISALTAIE